MDEREQLLAYANAASQVIEEMRRCENEDLYLASKEIKYKKREGWVWVGLILCPLLALGAFISLFTNPNAADVVGIFIMLGLAALSFFSLKKHNKRKARKPVVADELAKICSDPMLSWLPPDYRYCLAIDKITGYLYNMRAKTLQEALNLFETEKHQFNMELMAAFGAMNNGNRY